MSVEPAASQRPPEPLDAFRNRKTTLNSFAARQSPDNRLNGGARCTAWEPSERLRLLVVSGAGISIAIGLIAIAGWTLGLPALTRFFSARSAMQPITAACAMLGGCGTLQASGAKAHRSSSRVLAAAVLLAAAQTLVQYGLAVDLGTDRLLFGASVANQAVPYPYPGRMAVPTATSFLLLGIALLLAGARGRSVGLILSACATAVLLLVLVALLGYFYMVTPLTGVFGFTQVSVPTALALGGMALGVLALRPDQGWVRLLIGSSVGATAARWLLPTVVIVPIAVASLALRGSKVGLYPTDFRLAFTTAVTILLLAGLALWGAWQLDRLVAERETAERLRESEATLRAFFETEGLFAAIMEQRGDTHRYLTANAALAGLFGREDLAGLSVHEVQPGDVARSTIEHLRSIQVSGMPLKLERALDTGTGTRWFAVTISMVTGRASDPPRFAVAAFEITDRKRAERQQTLLLQELNHRVKNTLAVVQSLAQQSFRGDLADAGAKKAFEARLTAVASAHNLLVHQQWTAASMRALVTDVVGPGCGADRDRVDVDGPDIPLPPPTAVSLALALHELCTNAVKYGALSNDVGRVSINWSRSGDAQQRLHLRWQERGGPPVVAPTTRGFGSRMIERALAAELDGPVRLEFHPEGLVCAMDASLHADEQRA